MFKKLRRRLIVICLSGTGVIVVLVTAVCLIVSQQGLQQSAQGAWTRDSSAALNYLENTSVVSHSWLAKLESPDLSIYLFDNGAPFLFNRLYSERKDTLQVAQQAIDTANERYGFDFFTLSPGALTKSLEFDLRGEDGGRYTARLCVIPKGNSPLQVVFLYSHKLVDHEMMRLRILFVLADLVALGALWLFALLFTKRALQPVEENQKKQIEFISAASHELRSPLAVILSGISALEYAPPDRQKRFITSVHEEGLRMSRLVDDMLELARADRKSWSVTLAPISLDTLMLDIFEAYEPIAYKKKITLLITLPENAVKEFPGDSQRLKQVLSILLDNALSYTPAGGTVKLILKESKRGYSLHVRDNGPGVPEALKERIFERFYRADQSHQDREHFGLGLSIAMEIITLHHGSILVEDTNGGGADFIVFLPK